ncbi:hypothetical protein BGZ57DRAFT_749308, partial [Hyaloscypha finlandica]
YLWIDSSCIIQDSAVDKAIEISMMPRIYEGATVTLSVASTSGCGHGFLEDKNQIRDVIDDSFLSHTRSPTLERRPSLR